MNKTNDHPGRAARLIMRRWGEAALATSSTAAGKDGWPFASLVTVAADQDGAPLLLISKLAEHTTNIAADDRVSLLFAGPPLPGDDTLAAARVTVVGRARPSGDPSHRRRFLARHPEAAQYAGFADFSFYRVEAERAHLIAGFGEISWIDRSDLLADKATAAQFAEAEEGVVGHLNRDHLEAVGSYATALLGQPPGDWCVTGCDTDGLDLMERAGGFRARLDFDRPAPEPSALRGLLAGLARHAGTAK